MMCMWEGGCVCASVSKTEVIKSTIQYFLLSLFVYRMQCVFSFQTIIKNKAVIYLIDFILIQFFFSQKKITQEIHGDTYKYYLHRDAQNICECIFKRKTNKKETNRKINMKNVFTVNVSFLRYIIAQTKNRLFFISSSR